MRINKEEKVGQTICVFFIICFLAFSATSLFAEDQIIILEKEGEAVLGEDTTPAQARARALNNARRAAIEEACGGFIQGDTFTYKSKTISDLVSYAARGVIIKEEVLFAVPQTHSGVIIYRIKIRAHVKRLEEIETNVIQIYQEAVSRAGAIAGGAGLTFLDGDEIKIEAHVSDDCFLYLFCVDRNGMVTTLYPNAYTEQAFVPRGTKFVFPTDKQREMGLNLRVKGEKGRNITEESIVIIATKNKAELPFNREQDYSLTNLMKELSEIRTPWTVKVLGYEIRK